MFDPACFEKVKEAGDILIFIYISLFTACIHIFLSNLLIEQVCSEHHAMYEDMVDYGRLRSHAAGPLRLLHYALCQQEALVKVDCRFGRWQSLGVQPRRCGAVWRHPNDRASETEPDSC